MFHRFLAVAVLFVGGVEFTRGRADTIYLSEGTGISSYNSNGSGHTQITSTGGSGLALDASAGKLYFGTTTDQLQSVNLDGSNLSTVVTIPAKSYQPYFQLALDKPAGSIYWTDQVNTYIGSANLNGTNIQTLVSGTPASQTIRGIAVDPTGQHIYWGNSATHTVMEANLDGSNAVAIATGFNDVTSLAVDSLHHKLFFGDNATGTIYESNLDGSGLTALVTGLGNIFDIALNSTDTEIYSVNFLNQVYSANLDGSNKQLLFTDTNVATGGISGLAVFSGSAVPEPSSFILCGIGLCVVSFYLWKGPRGAGPALA